MRRRLKSASSPETRNTVSTLAAMTCTCAALPFTLREIAERRGRMLSMMAGPAVGFASARTTQSPTAGRSPPDCASRRSVPAGSAAISSSAVPTTQAPLCATSTRPGRPAALVAARCAAQESFQPRSARRVGSEVGIHLDVIMAAARRAGFSRFQEGSTVPSAVRVFKFGGTSVGTAEALRTAAVHVEADGSPLVVVVSAMAGITDLLLGAARAARDQDADRVDAAIRDFHDRHLALVRGTLVVPKRLDALSAEVER